MTVSEERAEGDDRSPEEPQDNDRDDPVFTGDPLDADFEVETVGEDEPSDDDEMTDPGPMLDPRFIVGPQLGEEVPPELDSPSLPDTSFDEAPSDPGGSGSMAAGPAGFDEDESIRGQRSGWPDDSPLGRFAAGVDGPGGSDEPDDEPGESGDQVGVSGASGDLPFTGPGGADELDGPDDQSGDEVGVSGEPPFTGPGGPDEPDDETRESDDPPVEPGSAADLPLAGPGPPDEPDDWSSFTDESYIRSATSEYLGLAEELARAAGEEEPEPSAVSAGIPGLESGLVGLDDVVGAERLEPAPSVPSSTDLGLRLLTAAGLLALFGLSLLSSTALTVLATIIFGLAAGEYYAVLVRAGLHPLSIFGLLGTAGALIGTAVWGLGAIPVALIATLVAVALFYALAAPRPHSGIDAGLTVLVVGWVALGAFAYPIIAHPDYRWLIISLVAVVVAMDAVQFFIGRRFGSRPMAPRISPKKTIEGLIGGAFAAVAMAVGLSFFGPLTLPSMLLLAAATIVLAPIGDLSVSLVKRIVGVKDMGTVLPGHGGILDRIDGLLFVIPAAWLVFEATGLLA